MSKNLKNKYFDNNFFEDDDDYEGQKEITADFISPEELSHRSKDNSRDKYGNHKLKSSNYIQNYKSSFKNLGYTDFHAKKKNNNSNTFTSYNNRNANQNEGLINNNTFNYEDQVSHQNNEDKEVRDMSHSPIKQKLMEALQNIDKNLFVKITKKDNRKIENFQVRRASNFREKTKNSLTSLGNVVNNPTATTNVQLNNTLNKNNISSSKNLDNLPQNNNNYNVIDNIAHANINDKSNNSIEVSKNNSTKSKLYQRNIANNLIKPSETISENNNEIEEIAGKNSFGISQKESTSKDINNNSKNEKMNLNNLTSQTSNINSHNESNISDAQNIYKRPARNHKREYSQDVNDFHRNNNIMNKISDNMFEVNKAGLSSSKHLEEQNKLGNKLSSTEYNIDLNTNMNNNSKASLFINVKNASNPESNENHRSNNVDLPFIYDESIKDHFSEEKEINVDSHIQINQRFLELLKNRTNEKISLKSNISVETACKLANEVLSEIKNKEMYDLMNKNIDLNEKNKELQKESNINKENMYKTSTSNNYDKSYNDMSKTVKDLQKYVLKLEKENVVLKNEFTNNIKNKNGMIKKFNEDLNDYQRITTSFFDKFSNFENETEE